ncbi:hypothetical protein BJX64DRAFT_293037 [Aspergillus heterothallicus]
MHFRNLFAVTLTLVGPSTSTISSSLPDDCTSIEQIVANKSTSLVDQFDAIVCKRGCRPSMDQVADATKRQCGEVSQNDICGDREALDSFAGCLKDRVAPVLLNELEKYSVFITESMCEKASRYLAGPDFWENVIPGAFAEYADGECEPELRELHPALELLRTDEGTRLYYTYHNIDTSPGFMASAQEQFQAHDGIEYKVLDIGKDPLERVSIPTPPTTSSR